jgi:hypothetical protein
VATILILDNDLGFAFWLGQTLTAPHCTALPALSVDEASALIGEFKLKVDFLIMNPAMPGAVEFTRALRKEQRQMRVATLATEKGDGDVQRNVRTVLARES